MYSCFWFFLHFLSVSGGGSRSDVAPATCTISPLWVLTPCSFSFSSWFFLPFCRREKASSLWSMIRSGLIKTSAGLKRRSVPSLSFSFFALVSIFFWSSFVWRISLSLRLWPSWFFLPSLSTLFREVGWRCRSFQQVFDQLLKFTPEWILSSTCGCYFLIFVGLVVWNKYLWP